MEKLIDNYLNTAVEKEASDLHLIVGKSPLVRIDGELFELDGEPMLTPNSIKELVYSMLNQDQKDRFEAERELDLSYEDQSYRRYRVNLHFEKDNIGLVARVIPSTIPSMTELGMPSIVYNLARMRDGLFLFTGPTGCGKSTSLAAIIDLINEERTANIITLEDPIEFIFKSKKSIIKQRQLGTDTLYFKTALRHILRQDPNVIMVGEMRDLETISSAITLAETGHLVLATLHTYSASQTIDRIIDIFPPHQQNQVRLQLSATLNGVISQRLLPKVGGGRVAMREILINTPAVANLIHENKISQLKTVIQTSANIGMVSTDQDVERLFKEGLISKEIALSYLANPDTLEK